MDISNNTAFYCIYVWPEEEDVKKPPAEALERWTPYIPEKLSRIMCGFHAKEEGKFWLSMVSVLAVIISYELWNFIQYCTQ